MLKPTIFLFLIKFGNKTKTRTDIKLANYSIDMIVGTTQKDWYNQKKIVTTKSSLPLAKKTYLFKAFKLVTCLTIVSQKKLIEQGPVKVAKHGKKRSILQSISRKVKQTSQSLLLTLILIE